MKCDYWSFLPPVAGLLMNVLIARSRFHTLKDIPTIKRNLIFHVWLLLLSIMMVQTQRMNMPRLEIPRAPHIPLCPVWRQGRGVNLLWMVNPSSSKEYRTFRSSHYSYDWTSPAGILAWFMGLDYKEQIGCLGSFLHTGHWCSLVVEVVKNRCSINASTFMGLRCWFISTIIDAW